MGGRFFGVLCAFRGDFAHGGRGFRGFGGSGFAYGLRDSGRDCGLREEFGRRAELGRGLNGSNFSDEARRGLGRGAEEDDRGDAGGGSEGHPRIAEGGPAPSGSSGLRGMIREGFVEPSVAGAVAFDTFQFLRNGYFCVDCKDSTPEKLVFNRVCSMKSSYKPA